jgi:hypothetical protein
MLQLPRSGLVLLAFAITALVGFMLMLRGWAELKVASDIDSLKSLTPRTPKRRLTKSRLAIVAILSIAIVAAGIMLYSWSWTYSEAANHYRHYASNYDPDVAEDAWATCYGSRWDSYMEQRVKDVESHQQDRPYRSAQAEYYRKLQRKYERAASRPWVPITLDPPLSKP